MHTYSAGRKLFLMRNL